MRSHFILLSTAAGLLISTVLFVTLPTGIYSGNISDLVGSIQNYLWFYSFYMILPIIICLIPTLALPTRFAFMWAALTGALALYTWIYGTFVVYNFGLIDGKTWTVQVSPWTSLGELALVILALALSYRLAKARPKLVALGTLFLALGGIYSAFSTITAYPYIPIQETDYSQFYRFSAEKNVLVVLLDSMQSDVFEEVLRERPELAAAFKGFLFYPNTAGVAPTTYLSVPAIHSGIEYDLKTPVPEYYQIAISKGSFTNQLVEHGYEATLVNPILSICPEKIQLCPSDASIIGGKEAAVEKDAVYLLDVALLRIVPLVLKPFVYNKGNWTFASFIHDPKLIESSVRGNNVMLKLAANLNVTAKYPTLKYLHLFSTHLPAVMDSGCNYVGELPLTREAFKTHVRCGLETLQTLLAALKQKHVYDKTAIILLSDHGVGLRNARAGKETASKLGSLMGSANPTLAFKAIDATEAFHSTKQPVSIADMSKILCDSIGDCSIPRITNTEKRQFNYYQWSSKYWRTSKLPSITQYAVGNPLWDTNSWEQAGKQIAIGDVVQFGVKGKSAEYRFYGWGEPEDWGIWTVENTAVLSFALPPRTQSLQLQLDTRAFLNAKGTQSANIYANKTLIGTIQYAKDTEMQKSVFDIPNEALDPSGSLIIKFKVLEPASPKDVIGTKDDRLLGIGLHSLSFVQTKT